MTNFVNATYDACKYLFLPLPYSLLTLAFHSRSTAGSLQWFDPDTGESGVYDLGDIAWVLASTALVWIMIPGVGFFYSGLLRRKNALSMIWLCMMTVAVVSFQVRPTLVLEIHSDLTLPSSGSSGGEHTTSNCDPETALLTHR